MKLFLTTAYQASRPLKALLASAALDKVGAHSLSAGPEEADAIVFVEGSHYEDDPFYEVLRAHSLVRSHRGKCLIHNAQDRPWHVLPGIYVSMHSRDFSPCNHRAYCYVEDINPHIRPDAAEPEYLFSFVGAARTARVRRTILRELRHPRAYLEDTSSLRVFVTWKQPSTQEAMTRYAEVLCRSKFVLCPRGLGTATFRLFEAMQAGRAPVIISDGWVPPEGPRWEEFAIRVRERDVRRVPELLAAREGEHARMGRLARQAWESFFAPEVRFARLGDMCQAIQRSRRESFLDRLPSRTYVEMRVRFGLASLARAIRRK